MLIDAHTHVNFKDFDDDFDVVIKRALEADIWMINVGTDMEMSQRAVELAHKYPEGVYSAVGIHPNDFSKEADFRLIAKMAEDEKVVGIGETGLDYFRTKEKEDQARQIDFFLKHIEIAKKVKKPIIIHCREAHSDVVQILKANAEGVSGVIHFFTGNLDDVKKYLDLGFYVSFAGVVTFTRDYDEVVKWVPLDRMLVETDAPFVAPVPERGKRNEPFNARYTAQKLAEIKGVSFEDIALQTTKNARELFKI